MDRFEKQRELMKSGFTGEMESDQMQGKPQPPLEKTFPGEKTVIDLPEINGNMVEKKEILQCIMDRKSHRSFLEEEITLEQLSFLLYTTQGVKEIRGEGYATIRPVPSAGARHPFETYVGVTRVKGLSPGLYHYSGLNHQLTLLKEDGEIGSKMRKAARNQKFVETGSATIIWTVIPYRGEWRYDNRSHKPMLLDAGHLCHGLYLSVEALGLGTCAIAAYEQDEMDKLLEIDGKEEFVVYLSPVGVIK